MNSRHALAFRRLALVALFLSPAVASAQTRHGGDNLGPAIGGIDYAFLLSLDIPPSGFDVGPRFAAEVMYGSTQLAPNLRLDLGARTSFAYHSFSGGGGNLWSWDIVPDARLVIGATPQLAFYGDFGAGLAIMHASADTVFGSASSTDLEATFQLGGGVSYAVSPQVNLLGEIRFDFYTKSGAGTFIAFPSVGIQFRG